MGGHKTQQKQQKGAARPQGGRERRAAGQARTGAYDVEEIVDSGLLAACDAAQAKKAPGRPETAQPPQEEDEEEEESDEEDQDEEDVKEVKPQGQRENVSQKASAGGTKKELAPPDSEKFGEDDAEVCEIEAELRLQLREWATDSTMPLEEQKRQVRQLLAQWHPDKNRHIHAVATRVFQFIQEEVNRIVTEMSAEANKAAEKEAGLREARAIRAAEKSAMASALKAAREEKQRQKGGSQSAAESKAAEATTEDKLGDGEAEWSLVVGHGPATTEYLRPWPRSHFTVHLTPLPAREGEILMFGGEAYDGREVTFYSDLYRLDMRHVEAGKPLPWEKLYSAAPFLEGPEPRSSHQVVVWDQHLYLFGGEWSSRDQKRYRQFNDLWRLDVGQGARARWERLSSEGGPCARSGHRMTASAATGHAVVYGGFSEDKRRRVTYLDDMHLLNLSSCSWTSVGSADRRRVRPGQRAACLLWSLQNAIFLYGGTRPKRKGGDKLEVFDDLWRGDLAVNPDTAAVTVSWEAVQPKGQGPGARTGLCQCGVSAATPHRRLVFGGVLDLQRMGAVGSSGRPAKETELSLFHNDVFLLDCGEDGSDPQWSRLWPTPGSGMAAPLDLALLPKDVDVRGGGADVSALVPVSKSAKGNAAPAPLVPRGRMAAGCFMHDGALWLFGGSCESGPKQEVTLDDLWRLPLDVVEKSVSSSDAVWECVLPLSDRATVWFDSDDSSDDESDSETGAAGATCEAVVAASSAVSAKSGGGTLSKKAMKEEAKKARVEAKQQKMQEKCDEKLSRRDAKREKQRVAAKGGD